MRTTDKTKVRKIALQDLSAKYRRLLPAIDLNTLVNLQEAANSGRSYNVIDVINNPAMKIITKGNCHLVLDFVNMLLAEYESPQLVLRAI